jgi:hypothetical protein
MGWRIHTASVRGSMPLRGTRVRTGPKGLQGHTDQRVKTKTKHVGRSEKRSALIQTMEIQQIDIK